MIDAVFVKQWYLEKVMKYINRNAYIIVAVKGSSFCMAANRAIQLIIINALRIATVNLIGDTLTWLGKVPLLGVRRDARGLCCSLQFSQ